MKKNKIMKKNYLLIIVSVLAIVFVFQSCQQNRKDSILKTGKIKKKKTQEEKRVYSIERELYELNMQKNPITGPKASDTLSFLDGNPAMPPNCLLVWKIAFLPVKILWPFVVLFYELISVVPKKIYKKLLGNRKQCLFLLKNLN